MPTTHNRADNTAKHGSGRPYGNRRQFLKTAGVAGAVGLAGCTGGIGGGSGPVEINILAWDDFKRFKEPIEEKLDVVINTQVSSSSSEMFSGWNAGQNEEFDITVPNNNYVNNFVEADLVAPVNKDAVTNWDSLFGTFHDFANEQFSDDEGNVYGVPIRFGWYGYSYDTRAIPEDHEASYEVLFSEEYAGNDMTSNVVMYDNHFKAMSATALYLGYQDAFEGKEVTLSEDQIQNVKETMLDQKPLISAYIAPDATFIKSFRQGDFLAGNCGRNEVMDMKREGDDWVEMASPKEGELAWFEGAVVSKESDNQEMAWKVVNQYIDPELGAMFAEFASTPSANPETNANLDDELQEMFGFGPERLEGMIPFKSVANEQAWIEAWEEIKAA